MKPARSMAAIKRFRKYTRRLPYGAYLTGVYANGKLNYYIDCGNEYGVIGWVRP